MRALRKVKRVVQDLRVRGREFQMEGAAKENERLPISDLISGRCSKCWDEARSSLAGWCRVIRS